MGTTAWQLPQGQPAPRREPLPLYPGGDEPLIAWRIWRVQKIRSEWLLGSVGKQTFWLPREPLHAECIGGSVAEPHRAPWPDGGCICGIWAFHQPRWPGAALYAYGGDPFSDVLDEEAAWALGTVKLWGRVVEHRLGYRGEYGYPHSLKLYDSRAILAAGLLHGSDEAPRIANFAEPGRRELFAEIADGIARSYLVPTALAAQLPHEGLYLTRNRFSVGIRYTPPPPNQKLRRRTRRLTVLYVALALVQLAFAILTHGWPSYLNGATAGFIAVMAVRMYQLSRRL